MRVAAINVLVGILLLVLCELLYSTLIWLFYAPTDIWIYEDVGQTVLFDTVRGYRLGQRPARFARITKGNLEFLGAFRGNSEGLPDRDDFAAERPSGITRRYAVLGDSFTSAQFIRQNWPDKTEDLSAASGERVQLLNFSVHGGGLANWVSITEGLLDKESYCLDGLIFAVYEDDLDRTFTIADGRSRSRMGFARVSGWDSAHYPRSFDEARALLDAQEIKATYILTHSEFNAALAGEWRPQPFWEFQFYKAFTYLARRWWQGRESNLSPAFSPGQVRLIETIRGYSDARGLPVLVVYLPGREQVAGSAGPHFSQVRQFAERLDAAFVDGRNAFSGLEPDALRQLWFEHDAHWNQAGSDLFARFMTRQLDTWPAGGDREASRQVGGNCTQLGATPSIFLTVKHQRETAQTIRVR